MSALVNLCRVHNCAHVRLLLVWQCVAIVVTRRANSMAELLVCLLIYLSLSLCRSLCLYTITSRTNASALCTLIKSQTLSENFVEVNDANNASHLCRHIYCVATTNIPRHCSRRFLDTTITMHIVRRQRRTSKQDKRSPHPFAAACRSLSSHVARSGPHPATTHTTHIIHRNARVREYAWVRVAKPSACRM